MTEQWRPKCRFCGEAVRTKLECVGWTAFCDCEEPISSIAMTEADAIADWVDGHWVPTFQEVTYYWRPQRRDE